MEIKARVSAGTYIRSIARDIALAAGTRAYLSSLKRTKVGPFFIKDAIEDYTQDFSPESVGEGRDNRHFLQALRPLDRNLFEALSLPCITLDEGNITGFLQGKPLPDLIGNIETLPFSPAAGVFNKNSIGQPDMLLGIINYQNNKWKYGHVFN